MSLRSSTHRILRQLVLGQRTVCDLPLRAPQTEIAVWLHGAGEPRDVTACHSVACPIPFTFCIALEEHAIPPGQPASLHFVERAGARRLLGIIKLRYETAIPNTDPHLHLYRATACTNFCISPPRRWARGLYLAAQHWAERHSAPLRPSALDDRCNEVAFICPRPVALGSYACGDEGNLFPMNLMGSMPEDHFVFALNTSKLAPQIVELGQLALSTVPFEHAEQVRQLGSHHRLKSLRWADVPFPLQPSPTLGIPIPAFALSVRELRVQHSMPLGSHTFFVARVLHRSTFADQPEFHRIHGLYAACRDDPSR